MTMLSGHTPAEHPDTSSGQLPNASPDKEQTSFATRSVRDIINQKRREKGLPVVEPPPWDHSNTPAEGSGIKILHQLAQRIVTLHPDNTVKKSGHGVRLGEAAAMRAAEQAGVPVPHVYGTETTPDGRNHIIMSYVEGETLEKLWDSLTDDEIKAIVGEMREILLKMHSATPPPNYVGGCEGSMILNRHWVTEDEYPPVQSEDEFVDRVLLATIPKGVHPIVVRAHSMRLHSKKHRIVLAHADLAPRNIIIKDKKVAAILDWETGGWYPEYWEFVKFMHQYGGMIANKSWGAYAEDIFPRLFLDELIDYYSLSRYRQ